MHIAAAFPQALSADDLDPATLERERKINSGEFFDLSQDAEEKRPLKVAALEGEAGAAAKLLQGALDLFKDARPAALDRPVEKAAKAKARKKR